MRRQSFYERKEREINFLQEYRKIEDIILNENEFGYYTLEREISESFRKWHDRGNYTSFYELRERMGFTYYRGSSKLYYPNGTISDINDFLLYCEMVLNMIWNVLYRYSNSRNEELMQTVINTIAYDLELINHTSYTDVDGKIFIVQKDAAASSVADFVETDLGEEVIKYNHFLLKGDIAAKRQIIEKIAHALEPKRSELKVIHKTTEDNFFYMVNNMNVRHNNNDPADTNHYKEKYALLSDAEKEEWYDEIYQEGLLAFLLLQQEERKERIRQYKSLEGK